MADIRADEPTPLDDEDRLPWLEAVDEDEDREGPSPLKLIVAVLVGLFAIGLVVGGLYWLVNRPAGDGTPELIAADEGDYKSRPDDPGGMKVEGAGETSFAASAGAEPKGTINVDAIPETPVTKAPPAPKPTASSAKKPAPGPWEAPQPAVTLSGPSIQLGAFSSPAAATSAWKALSSRFKYLSPLSHAIIPVRVEGKTLYRLRAAGPNAADLCGRLRVAGETCVTVS